ncbi:D-mannonate oxidoreductase (plasmid) [Neorhizobium sp. SOG26]|uniref:mannitol dehydrogenase family protein n=1 Tax=Neorhizobium sp. SOG26 TaxID=2060726 RepID=UPI000E5752AE|nr:mannitol dehydrogenase family protein [Neorhizobium sp. SOG26]AXV17560.1 D-mannonate oxidoreductase [Neorhizobium sp. SOG26]
MTVDGIILQFGTSRFLQAHADLFLHEAAEAGQAVLPVTIVQTSGSAERVGRLAAFSDPDGFPVIIRGLEDGQKVERRVAVKSVKRGLSTATHWPEIVDLFARQSRFIISNTGDAGYEVSSDDSGSLDGSEPAASFPGKLAQLLHARFQAGGEPITVLPCELINGNGPVLKARVMRIAERRGDEPAFLAWLDAHVIFANTLVDRIVSEPLEPAGAVAEPYALWAIERAPGLVLPCRHPSIQLVDDIEPFERLKLHILNLGHTVLAEIWLAENRRKDEFVREIMSDPAVRARLLDIYDIEVMGGFAAQGMGEQARAYVATTLERFDNPFLDHRIADIASNHALKVARRLGAFLKWSKTPSPKLQAIVDKYPHA